MSSGYVYVVSAFAVGLFWVCGAWNRQEERFTSMGLLRCRRGPQLRCVPGLQQEGIRAAVGIACTSYIMDRLYKLGSTASEGQARSTTESFNKMVEVQNAATLLSSSAPFWQISLRS